MEKVSDPKTKRLSDSEDSFDDGSYDLVQPASLQNSTKLGSEEEVVERGREVEHFTLRSHEITRTTGTLQYYKPGIGHRVFISVFNSATKLNRRFFEIFTTFLFIALLVAFILVGVYLNQPESPPFITGNLCPSGLEGLEEEDCPSLVVGSLDEEISKFYSMKLPGGNIISVNARSNTQNLDTTLEVRETVTNELVAFNDDVATDNNNSILFWVTPENKNTEYIIKLSSFEKNLENVNNEYSLETFVVKEELKPGAIATVEIPTSSPYISAINLIGGDIYQIFALGEDTTIRVRDKTGEILVQVLQSTVQQLEGSVLFKAPRDDIYILELREVNLKENSEIKTHVNKTQLLDLNVSSNSSISQPYDLYGASSTILSFTGDTNVKYELRFSIELNELALQDENYAIFGDSEFDEDDENGLKHLTESNDNVAFVTSGISEALSMKLYDIDINEILLRERSKFDAFVVDTFNTPEQIENLGLDFDASITEVRVLDLNPQDTTISFVSLSPRQFVIDITTLYPRYLLGTGSSKFDEEVIGKFTIEVNFYELDAEEIEELSERVDQGNLFAACENQINQAKYTLINDLSGCSTGILLFCRNEFFPKQDPEFATKAEFAQICECVDFLCATLPSGGDVNTSFRRWLNISYGIFATVSIICFLLYFFSTLDLIIYGGFIDWLSRGFGTWTISAMFFFTAFMFFVSEIMLNRQIDEMNDIAEAFDLNQIIPPNGNLGVSYYESLAEEIRGSAEGSDDPGKIGENFLNAAALNEIPDGLTFTSLRTQVVVNIIALVLLQALAVIGFLDISVVWIESSKAMSLNRKKRKNDFKKFIRSVRVAEVSYMMSLVLISYNLAVSNGESYSLFSNVLVFMLSILIVFLYIAGRRGLRRVLSVSTHNPTSLEASSSSYWVIIRQVSTIVIAANVGVAIVQVYFMVQVQDFNDLVSSNNDAIILSLLFFQYICIFAGQLAIFYYLAGVFFRFRESLFDEIESFEDDNREVALRGENRKVPDHPESTNRELIPSSSATTNPMFESDINKAL